MRSVASEIDLTIEERSETLSGGGNRSENRVYWATLFLSKAAALVRPQRGYLQITPFGSQLLEKYGNDLTLSILEETDGVREWRQRSELAKSSRSGSVVEEDEASQQQTPDELIASAYAELLSKTAADIVEQLHSADWEFLEHAVLKVLHAMGYGSSKDDLAHLGQSGDGGVDGVINQDRLGLDQIYIQAKRYKPDTSIGRPDIQSFVGAVTGRRATRGIFITTSRFSKDARHYAVSLSTPRIILIDGSELANLMLEHEIGVTVQRNYKVYEIDSNFFEV